MKPIISLLILVAAVPMFAVPGDSHWRAANDAELKALIPARAPVEKERIETEFRTASGVTDGRGKFIAGVLMITAGYSAEGKYSHFFTTQVAVKMGDFTLPAGEYVFGYQRVDDEALEVKFYRADNGTLLGSVKAHRESRRGPIRSFAISPPTGGAFSIQIGRFKIDCKVAG